MVEGLGYREVRLGWLRGATRDEVPLLESAGGAIQAEAPRAPL